MKVFEKIQNRRQRRELEVVPAALCLSGAGEAVWIIGENDCIYNATVSFFFELSAHLTDCSTGSGKGASNGTSK